MTPLETEIQRLKELCEKARQEVYEVCKGKSWTMCIPVRNDDSDVVICNGLDANERLLAALEVAIEQNRIINQNTYCVCVHSCFCSNCETDGFEDEIQSIMLGDANEDA